MDSQIGGLAQHITSHHRAARVVEAVFCVPVYFHMADSSLGKGEMPLFTYHRPIRREGSRMCMPKAASPRILPRDDQKGGLLQNREVIRARARQNHARELFHHSCIGL